MTSELVGLAQRGQKPPCSRELRRKQLKKTQEIKRRLGSDELRHASDSVNTESVGSISDDKQATVVGLRRRKIAFSEQLVENLNWVTFISCPSLLEGTKVYGMWSDLPL